MGGFRTLEGRVGVFCTLEGGVGGFRTLGEEWESSVR